MLLRLPKNVLHRLLRSSSIWAVGDQLCVSAGNFLTSLLLARLLAPRDFGTFVLINSVFLLLNGFHANLIVAPLMVLASSSKGRTARHVFSGAILFTLLLTPFALVALCGACLHLRIFSEMLLALVALSAWQLQEAARRSLHAAQRYSASVVGDLISYPGQTLVLLWMWHDNRPSLHQVFLIMTATSLLAFLLQILQLQLSIPSLKRVYCLLARFAKLGGWLFVSSLTSVLVLPLMPWLLNGFHGREAAAGFQAAANVLGMANPLVLSIAGLVTPAAARLMASSLPNPAAQLGHLGKKYSAGFLTVLAPWFAFVLIAPHTALRLFYGSASPYLALVWSLRIGVLVYLLTVPLTVFCAILNGAGMTRKNALMQGAGAITSLICAPPLIYFSGVPGAMLATALSLSARLWISMRMLAGRPAAQRSGAPVEVEL